MTTQVALEDDECPLYRRQVATVLGFLVKGQRKFDGVTLQGVAASSKIQRSNLSAYICSHGRRRNVSGTKLRRALNVLGLHWDFTLMQQLHRWDIGKGSAAIEGLRTILAANRVRALQVMPAAGKKGVNHGFVVMDTVGDVVCLLRVQKRLFGRVCTELGVTMKTARVDESAFSAVKVAWMMDVADEKDAPVSERGRKRAEAERAVRALLHSGPKPAGLNGRRTVRERLATVH